MADNSNASNTVAIMIVSQTKEQMGVALDLASAAAMMEMAVHIYMTGNGVGWLVPADMDADVAVEARPGPEQTPEVREQMLARLANLQGEGDVSVYACSRAMARHGLTKDRLPPVVNHPAGFAFFLDIAGGAAFSATL
jgi:peroxiredoxin family protein